MPPLSRPAPVRQADPESADSRLDRILPRLQVPEEGARTSRCQRTKKQSAHPRRHARSSTRSPPTGPHPRWRLWLPASDRLPRPHSSMALLRPTAQSRTSMAVVAIRLPAGRRPVAPVMAARTRWTTSRCRRARSRRHQASAAGVARQARSRASWAPELRLQTTVELVHLRSSSTDRAPKRTRR
jgi:hypothetical protein